MQYCRVSDGAPPRGRGPAHSAVGPCREISTTNSPTGYLIRLGERSAQHFVYTLLCALKRCERQRWGPAIGLALHRGRLEGFQTTTMKAAVDSGRATAASGELCRRV